MMQFDQSQIHLPDHWKQALLSSDKLSIEEKHSLFKEPEVIASPPDLNAFKSEDPSKETERIEILEEIKEQGLKYTKYKKGQRDWLQSLYRSEEKVLNNKLEDISEFKRTRLKNIEKQDSHLGYKALHEKTRRWNKNLKEDGFLTSEQRRKADLPDTKWQNKRRKKGLGRYSSNSDRLTGIGFKTLKFLEQHKMLFRSQKDIKYFLKTGIKPTFKKTQKNARCGVSKRQMWSITEGRLKDSDIKEYRSLGSASTDPLGSENKKPPKEAKELSLWMPKELEKRLGLTEDESALIAQARTLLKNNGNDLGKAKKQYRVLLEVVKDLNIRNKKGWLQTAIDKNFEFKEEETAPTTPPSPSTHQKQKTPEVTLQEKSAIKEIVQVIKKLSLANRISPKMPFIWLRRFGGLERILNALWAVFEQIRKGNEIKNPEAYITKAIQEGYKPKNHTVEEYRTIYRNMEELERRIPQLKAKGIDVTKQKIYIDKKLRWEIVLNRKNICDGIADLHIAIINPRLGELIAGFEQKHDAEQNNISENEGWLKETVKELEQTYEKLKTKRTTTGYRLMMPAEMFSNGQTHRFIDHAELKTANPRAVLEGNLQGFLERNHLGASSW